MALCVQPESYSDFVPPLASYGAGTPYPGQPPLEGGVEIQIVTVPVVSQSQWNQHPTEPVQFWQDENGGGQSPNDGGEWQGGMAPMSYTGGWVGNGSSVQPPPRPMNGLCSSGQQQQRLKRRFCTSFPEVQLCRRGSACSFAHSREEIRAPLLATEEEQQDPDAMTDDFFMYKYKTHWCPIGVQHEWHTCVYAHNYQDARRPVAIGYGARLCPYWSKKDTGSEYSQRCPLGLRCPYAHGAKEQLYHPHYFKTVVCRDLKMKACPRQGLCAFFHHRQERRAVSSHSEEIDYSQPLLEEALDKDWADEFLTPPFLPEAGGAYQSNQDGMSNIIVDGMAGFNPCVQTNGNGDWSAQQYMKYGGPQAPHAPYGMQQPFVFLMPYQPMSPQQAPQSAVMGGQLGSPMPQSDMATQMNAMGGNSPMAPQMNAMGGNWVFVPVESQQPAAA